jgi:hypothetical protein
MPILKRRSLLNLLDHDDERPKTSSLLPEAATDRPKSEYGFSRSRLSHEVLRDELPDPQDSQSTRVKRFSMLKLRNYSESQLSFRVKDIEKKDSEDAPPMPSMPSMPSSSAVPAIVRTAPTLDHNAPKPQEDAESQEQLPKERKVRPSLFKRSMSKGRSPSRKEPSKSMDERRSERKGSSLRWRKLQGRSTGLEDLQRMAAANTAHNQLAPPSYGDESNSALALPVPAPRFSESAQSDGSNGSSDQIYGSTTTTTHTVSTHTTFFKLARRNKNRNSLFPLPVQIPPPGQDPQQEGPPTPRASNNTLDPNSSGASATALQRRHTEDSPIKNQAPASSNAALARGALSFAEPGGMSLLRNASQRSRASSNSSPLQPPRRLGMRDRASTTSSFGRSSHDMGTPPPLPGSGRNSTSTTGRSSLGGFLNLSRFRQSSDPHSPHRGSPGTGSKSNSFAMSREALVVPEREEGDTPGKYLERLEAAVSRSMIATILSKSPDPFAQAVLRSYTRRFPFFGEPIDMSLRKFLLEAELPKETQQVDRVIQAFADRYHECNPGIFVSSDQAYVIAFSLMMLHTDAFNKNNKRKMQKQDYIRNTSGQSVSDDVLACFYDNICYTPFVHYEEDVDINGERVLPFKPKKNKVKTAMTDGNKKPSGPVDPYNLLVEQKLEMLRPSIRESISMEDPYDYKSSQKELEPAYLQRAFTHTGTLQIISQRSRPTAYEGQLTNHEPPALMEMQPGIIDIKVTKVGMLWRKDAKKKKARSPWNEWGAVLTGSQLYLFKNTHWVKSLMQQFNSAQEKGRPRTPVTFKPPLQEFKPDALLKTDNAVALIDSTYNRHKHAFTFIGPGGHEEVLLADNDSEQQDWLALINYAAAFRAAGVRIRGMIGGAEEDLRSKDVRRLESTQSARSAQTTESEVALKRVLSPQLHRQVMTARRQIMVQKVSEASKEIAEQNKELDDMLRNARHLLVLAPIAPKTREDMIHAAARTDASLKWKRRDIWRIKCYKHILAMDVQQDGVSADEIEALAEQHVAELPESTKKPWPLGLSRLTSRGSGAKSPSQSPTSPTFLKRPSTTGSLEAYTNDIFRTPPENSSQQQTGEWSLPPLQLDVQTREPQRGSISSTLLSASSRDRNSVSQGSTTSGQPQRDTQVSEDPADGATPRPRAPSSAALDPEVELLARATITPEPVSSRPLGLDGTTPHAAAATPESASKHRSGVRRSLQKTLRDSHHHPSTSHKHRKGKESDGTIRSAGAGSIKDGVNPKDVEKDETVEEGTPGLKREKGRFILHGKQASVVQFGTEWPSERMKARREAWRQSSASTSATLSSAIAGAEQTTPTMKDGFSYGWGSMDAPGYPTTSTNGEANDGTMSPGTAGLAQDAETAEAFAERRESPAGIDDDDGEEEYFNASPTQAERKRETVIGPSKPVKQDSEDEGVSPTRNSKRTTVIGPATSSQSSNALGLRVDTNGNTQAGAEREDSDDDDDEYTTPPSDGYADEETEDVFRPASSHAIEVR